MTDEDLDDLSQRMHAIYDQQLRGELEPIHDGQFVAIHIDTADYVVADTSSRARSMLRDRQPIGMIGTTKIGPSHDDTLAYRILAGQLLSGQRK